VNWFVLVASVLYFGGGLYDFWQGRFLFGGVWFCYALANVFLLFLE